MKADLHKTNGSSPPSEVLIEPQTTEDEFQRLLDNCWKPSIDLTTKPTQVALIVPPSTMTTQEKPTVTVSSYEYRQRVAMDDGTKPLRVCLSMHITWTQAPTWTTKKLSCGISGGYHSLTEKNFTKENRPAIYTAAANDLMERLAMIGALTSIVEAAIKDHLQQKATEYTTKEPR